MGTEKQISKLPSGSNANKQQNKQFFSGQTGVLQRQTPQSTTTASEATEADRRSIVNDAIHYLQQGAGFYSEVRLTNESFERILTHLLSVLSAQENSITTSLQNDMALLQSLHQAFTSALRALMMRAAAQLNKPLIRLYLENMYRIPAWAWPDSAAFNLTNETQRRQFIQATIDAFNDTTLFAGYQQITETALRDILTRLQNLVNDQERIIQTQLNNDAALKQQLHTAYSTTLRQLLFRASTAIGQQVDMLYLRFRYVENLIPDWADQQITGLQEISTPLAIGASADPITGEVSFTLNGVTIIILPDGRQTDTGAQTKINIDLTNILHYQHTTGNHPTVTSFTLGTPVIRIQTFYGPGLTSSSTSGYGRGTTAADRAESNTTLRFHEGNHGRDFLRFLMNNQTFPQFTGANGMTKHDFLSLFSQYQNAWDQYRRNVQRTSELNTDCVGFTIEQYYQSLNPPQPSPVACH